MNTLTQYERQKHGDSVNRCIYDQTWLTERTACPAAETRKLFEQMYTWSAMTYGTDRMSSGRNKETLWTDVYMISHDLRNGPHVQRQKQGNYLNRCIHDQPWLTERTACPAAETWGLCEQMYTWPAMTCGTDRMSIGRNMETLWTHVNMISRDLWKVWCFKVQKLWDHVQRKHEYEVKCDFETKDYMKRNDVVKCDLQKPETMWREKMYAWLNVTYRNQRLCEEKRRMRG